MTTRLQRVNRRTALTAAVVAVLATAFLTSALRAEGFRATEFDLNDSGVWVTHGVRQFVGRVNTELEVIDTRMPTSSTEFDVLQSGSTVLLHGRPEGKLAVVDVRLASITGEVDVPLEGLVLLGGPTAAIVDVKANAAWWTAADRVADLDVTAAPPGASSKKGLAVAVGTDGLVHVVDLGTGEVSGYRPDGGRRSWSLDDSLTQARITAVGGRAVVLDVEQRRLHVEGRDPVDLSSFAENPVLQQPGEDAADVVVATDRELLAVPLDGGKARVLTDGGTGTAAEPVALAGCAYGAWQSAPSFAQLCDDRRVMEPLAEVPSPSRLRFRVNRGRVVLNEMVSGANLLFGREQPKRVDDWDQALEPKREEGDDETEDSGDRTVLERTELDRSAPNRPPVAVDDERATRPGRPVVVRPLKNDSDPDGDVLVVDAVEGMSPGAAVDVIDGGQAVQVTPAPDRVDPVTFSYRVSDGRGGEDTGVVTVAIRHPDENAPPTAVNDLTIVEAGKTVVHNVLVNDEDPDGDLISLSGVAPEQGTAQWRSDGEIVFTAPGTTTGPVKVPYVVVDERGASSRGQLTVDVRAPGNLPPTARGDQVSALVDRQAEIDVLRNDSDPNGDALSVVSVTERPDATIAWQPDGVVRVSAAAPGSYDFLYEITDGSAVAKGILRLDVVEASQQHPPVAVRDDVVLRADVPAIAAVLENDWDADRDVLVVQRVVLPVPSPVTVEVIDRSVLRISAVSALTQPFTFTYVISDGTAQSVGTVIVRPAAGAAVNQPPVAKVDELTVRAGNAAAIPVLRNDYDPDGDALRLVDVQPVAPEDGMLFVQGDELRYLAPLAERGSVSTRYTVQDAAGNQSTGEVLIHVTSRDPARNNLPVAPDLEARVFAGAEVTIRVPLVGLDPDGDAVALLGVGEPPSLGQVVSVEGDRLVYRADRNAGGTDRFTYRLIDDLGGEATGVVRVGVVPPPDVNSPPVALPDTAAVQPGGSVRVDVLRNDTDPDDDALSVLDDLGQPRRGRATLDGDVVVFQAAADALVGPITFDYGVTDGRGGTARGAVTVSIGSDVPPQPPVARDDVGSPVKPGSKVDLPLLENDEDPDGSLERATVTVEPAGVATVVDGRLRLDMPNQSVTVVYTLTDEQGLTAKAIAQIPVLKDQPPVAVLDEATTKKGEPVRLDVLENDIVGDGRDLTLLRIVSQRNGEAAIDGSEVVFRPAPGFVGDAGFTYEISDGARNAVGAGAVVVEGDSNTAPTVSVLPVEVPAGGSIELDLKAAVSDADPADDHDFGSLSAAPTGLSASLSGSTLSIRADEGAKGLEARLTYEVTDAGGATAEGVVTVKVLSSEKPPPIAVADAAETFQEKPVTVDVLANDADPFGKGLTIDAVSAVEQGEVIIVGGKQLTFTPAQGFFGQTTFTYTVRDGTGDADRAATGTVTVAVIGRPSAPAAPSGVVESKAVQLTWGVPAANGAAIAGYVVEDDKGTRTDCPTNACRIGNLTNGQTYRFRVLAKNAAGDGAWSELSAALVPDARPGTPVAPTAVFGDKQITVSWVAPANDGTAITGYTLQMSPPPAGGVAEQKLEGATTSYVWTGLTNGTAYSFRVFATNAAGSSETSPSSAPETPAGVPQGLAAPTVTRGDGFVTVNWTAAQPNGDAVQAYQVLPIRNGTDQTPIDVSDPALRTLRVPAENAVSYSFKVRARNKAGWSAYSVASAAVTPAGNPYPVEPVSASEGDRSSTLTFTAPNSNGAPITSYKVSINNGAAQTLASSRVVSGLTNGTDYSFRVQACNDVGCGSFGSPSNVVNPYGAPVAPTVTATASGQNIRWNWNMPSGNGRPIARFEVRVVDYVAPFDHGLNQQWDRDWGYTQSRTACVTAINTSGTRSAEGCASASTAGVNAVVDNRVTNGSTQMREDDQPAFLTDRPESSATYKLPGTDMWSGYVLTLFCTRGNGARVTNGEDNRAIDDSNPGLYTSTRWYQATWPDGRSGWFSEVWLRSDFRGGLGLPGC